jgi:hypothetical protein
MTAGTGIGISSFLLREDDDVAEATARDDDVAEATARRPQRERATIGQQRRRRREQQHETRSDETRSENHQRRRKGRTSPRLNATMTKGKTTDRSAYGPVWVGGLRTD